MIEFMVLGKPLAGDKNFAARVLPEPAGNAGRPPQRNAYLIEVSLEDIGNRQRSARHSADARTHTAHRAAGSFRMARQRDLVYQTGRHRTQAYQDRNAWKVTGSGAAPGKKKGGIAAFFLSLKRLPMQ
jgi:hypothetical protein